MGIVSWVKGQAASFPKPFYLFEGYELIKKFFCKFSISLLWTLLLLLFDGLKLILVKFQNLI